MNRVVWLLLAVFCTALTRVQPVELANDRAMGGCSCCHVSHPCEMPSCCPSPSAALGALADTKETQSYSARFQCEKRAVLFVKAIYSFSLIKTPTVSASYFASTEETRVAGAPLYKVQGRLVI